MSRRSTSPILSARPNEILDSAKVAVDHVQAAAGNISEITAKINAGKGTAGALLNDRTMYKEASASVAAMHEDLEALKGNFLLRGFFNKRGYIDADELKKHEISALPAEQPIKTFAFETKQIFDKANSAKLKNNFTALTLSDPISLNFFYIVRPIQRIKISN